MKIAIDISPISTGHHLQHRVRGTGFYLTNLRDSLLKYFPETDFIFFNSEDKLSKNIDIIHIPYFEPFFITLPIYKKYKTIVTVHDLTPLVFKENFPSGLKGKIKWEVQKKSLQRVDFVITDSFSSKEDIHKYAEIPLEKIHVVYLAAAKSFKKRTPNKNILSKFNLPNEFLLYVGDATWNKNLPSLIKAVNKTSYNLVIAGSAFVNKDYDKTNPWNKDLHEAQVLAEGNNSILPLGFVSDEELIDLYNLATAFIMPSLYEGFGLPILEAMQSGCPVITSRSGSLSEVADSAAYFIDPNSIESIINGIEEVMSKKDLRDALSKRGLDQANKFSWEKTANETFQVYQKISNSE